MLSCLSACLSMSLPVCLFLSSTRLYLSLCLPLFQSVSIRSILSVPFLSLPDNLSFCLLSLTIADFLCTSLSLYCSERQPGCLPVHYNLIYYLWLSVFLHLPSCLSMFLSVIPLNSHRLPSLPATLFTPVLVTEMFIYVSEVVQWFYLPTETYEPPGKAFILIFASN